MEKKNYDIVFIGGGPAGYVGAIRAAQLGLKTACVEKRSSLGGTCLNVGCLPSKSLLDSSEKYLEAKESLAAHGVMIDGVRLDLAAMMDRKSRIVDQLTKGIAFLFKKNKIDSYQGAAELEEFGCVKVSGQENTVLCAKNIVIATGSMAAGLPGVEWIKGRIETSTEALSYSETPKRLIVIGAGAIGLELGSVWNRLGCEVTIVELFDQILPGADQEIARTALRYFKKQKLVFKLGAKVKNVRLEGDGCSVELKQCQERLESDRVLVAVGRKPYTQGLNLGTLGVQTDEKGFVKVNQSYQTTVSGVFAVGDVIGGPMLAHKASEEAIACVEIIATGKGHVNYETVPSIVYTDPEVAWVGKTEEALKKENIDYRKGTFAFKANGRALAMGNTDGLVKILAHAETDHILGIHITGPRAGDLIAEATVAMEHKALAKDIAGAWHAHPTLCETLKEAALDTAKRAIHA